MGGESSSPLLMDESDIHIYKLSGFGGDKAKRTKPGDYARNGEGICRCAMAEVL